MADAKTKMPREVTKDDDRERDPEVPEAGRFLDDVAKCEYGMMPIVVDWLQNKLFAKNQQWLSVAADHTVVLNPAPSGAKRITVNIRSEEHTSELQSH